MENPVDFQHPLQKQHRHDRRRKGCCRNNDYSEDPNHERLHNLRTPHSQSDSAISI